jgi:hypothetical protein
MTIRIFMDYNEAENSVFSKSLDPKLSLSDGWAKIALRNCRE